MSMPLRQQVKIVPVEHWLDAVATAKAEMVAQNQDWAFPAALIISAALNKSESKLLAINRMEI